MEIVANIWDRVFVVDNLIDLKIVDDYCVHLESLGEKTLAYLQLGPNEPKIYDDGSGVYESPCESSDSLYIQKLFESNMIPKLKNCGIETYTKVHSMIVGSLMAIHTDSGYSIAVTTYITDCVGGELVVENPETGELGKIEPKRGRTVILKCDTPHSVLEVIDGERKSLQTFIIYIKGENDE